MVLEGLNPTSSVLSKGAETIWLPLRLENLKMRQIHRISDDLTLLVAVDTESKEIVIATGTGGLEDFHAGAHISLPIETIREIPEFLEDFLTSWDTSRSAERVRRILEMGETPRGIGNEAVSPRKDTAPVDSDRGFEERCAICGRKVTTESGAGWFKLYREGRVIWICPDHDSREALLFAQS